MPTTSFVAILVLLAAAGATDVAAEPIFASPPHFVADGGGRRIVLFLNEPVSGALAARGPSGSYEIRVPRSAVAPNIQGQDFGADGWGNGGDAVRHLVLAAGAKGDTNIRIEPTGPVGGVDAHAADDPPRLVIELLASAPTRTPVPTRTTLRSPAAKASRSPAAKPTRSPVAKASSSPVAKATKRPAPTKTPRPHASAATKAVPSPLPVATAAIEPLAIAAARSAAAVSEPAPSAEELARATVLAALAPHDAVAAEPLGQSEPPEHSGQSPEHSGQSTVHGDAPAPSPPELVAPPTEVAAAKSSKQPKHAEAHQKPHDPEPHDPEPHDPEPHETHEKHDAHDAHEKPAQPDQHAAPAALASPTPKAKAGASATHAASHAASGTAPSSRAPAPVVAAPIVPKIPSGTSPFGVGCLWRRVAGVAFCAADPKAAPYVGDHTVMAMVGAVARGKLPEPEDRPAIETPAVTFIDADVAFMKRAEEGKLLPVVDTYRRALRKHPDFPEAWRARLNIALAYRAMEFRAELRTMAREAALDPTAGLIRGLAGDLDVVTGYLPAAAGEYRQAADIGGVGSCLAARGRARLALAANDPAAAAGEVAALGSLCPPDLLADSETTWVRARLALAQRDPKTARTLLTEIEHGLGKQDQGSAIVDIGAVAEAEGDAKAARKSYERLLDGAYGARAVRQATVRLAILDGVGGDVTAGLKRLERLTPEASDPARRTLVMQSVRSALARGEVGEALGSLHEARIDPALLGLDEQLVVAEAYRAIGLVGEAERVVSAAQEKAGPDAPDALFAERGALALARHDGPQALTLADEWIRARGRTAGALALRARAAAVSGDGVAAHAAVAAAVIEDAGLTRTLALEVAEMLRQRAPAAALVLAREALDPGPTPALPPARQAAGLALVGTLAEAAGDDDTALAAFTTLTARYGKEPVAADAAYRAARLASRRVPGGAPAAYEEAARSKDPLARRMAGAARDYEAIVRPLGGAPTGGKATP